MPKSADFAAAADADADAAERSRPEDAPPTIFAERAWLPGRWARDVRIHVSGGRFGAVDAGQKAGPDDVRVYAALPGLVNAHSHAFQRALVAQTEAPQRAAGGDLDSFWSWREGMYRLAARISPDALRITARQLYAELLAGGYTSVVEFHYLFAASPTARGSLEGAQRMMRALAGAAEDVGIRLVWVPVLYAWSGFGSAPPGPGQRPFVLDERDYMAHLEEALQHEGPLFRVGAGVHSLRAVSGVMMRRVAGWAARNARPMHLHIAEQPREVADCVAATGRRPVAWLLEEADVNASWCLVHATHMDAEETEALARSGAVVCVCPTTEANLGDGFFRLRQWLAAGGQLAVGSDSQVGTNAFEELRWLEYGQRLATGTRSVASHAMGRALRGRPSADVLFEAVLEGGHRAAGLVPDGLATGGRAGGGYAGGPSADAGGGHGVGLVAGAAADLVAFGRDDARFAGHDDHTLLSALVFSATPPRADGVMTAGRWVLTDGACRGLSSAHGSEFARIMRSLYPSSTAAF